MQLELSSAPLCIPNTTPPAVRERILNQHAQFAAHSQRIRDLANYFRGLVASAGGSMSVLDVMLGWVQRLPYVDDPKGRECFQGVFYTIQNGGDCEDKSCLFAALAIAAGYNARVAWLDQPGMQYNHYAVLVGPPGELWAETTVVGAPLGEHPWDAARRLKHPTETRIYRPGGALYEEPAAMGVMYGGPAFAAGAAPDTEIVQFDVNPNDPPMTNCMRKVVRTTVPLHAQAEDSSVLGCFPTSEQVQVFYGIVEVTSALPAEPRVPVAMTIKYFNGFEEQLSNDAKIVGRTERKDFPYNEFYEFAKIQSPDGLHVKYPDGHVETVHEIEVMPLEQAHTNRLGEMVFTQSEHPDSPAMIVHSDGLEEITTRGDVQKDLLMMQALMENGADAYFYGNQAQDDTVTICFPDGCCESMTYAEFQAKRPGAKDYIHPTHDRVMYLPGGALIELPPSARNVAPRWQLWEDPILHQKRYSDFSLARGWLAWLADFTKMEQMEEINKLPFENQQAYVRAAWNGLANAYNAANFDPMFDPAFQDTYQQYYGIQSRDAGGFTVRSMMFSVFGNRIMAMWQQLGKNPADLSDPVHFGMPGVHLIIRASINAVQNEKAFPVFHCDASPFEATASGQCDFRPGVGNYNGCSKEGQSTEGCGDAAHPYDWLVWNWHDPPQGTNANAPSWRFLPPLRWSFEFINAIVKKIRTLSVEDWVTNGIAHLIMTNVLGAQRVGLLEGNDFEGMRHNIEEYLAHLPPPGNREEAAEFARTAVNTRNAASGILGGIATIAGALGAATAGVGLIVAAIAGLAAAAVQLFRPAIGLVDRPQQTIDGRPIFYPPGQTDETPGFAFNVGNGSIFTSETEPPALQIPPVPPRTTERLIRLPTIRLPDKAKVGLPTGTTLAKIDNAVAKLDQQVPLGPQPNANQMSTTTQVAIATVAVGTAGGLLWWLSKSKK